jgi:hypothetical protein
MEKVVAKLQKRPLIFYSGYRLFNLLYLLITSVLLKPCVFLQQYDD